MKPLNNDNQKKCRGSFSLQRLVVQKWSVHMAKAIQILINVIHSAPEDCANSETLLQSKSDAITTIIKEIDARLAEIPNSDWCSIVTGSKDINGMEDFE